MISDVAHTTHQHKVKAATFRQAGMDLSAFEFIRRWHWKFWRPIQVVGARRHWFGPYVIWRMNDDNTKGRARR